MIVTKDFVFIHSFRCGGTFINQLIEEHLGGEVIGYHLPYSDIPDKYKHLPVISSVRNPWDWYLSVYYHCLNFKEVMKTDSILNHITNFRGEGFEDTIKKIIDLKWMTPQDIKTTTGFLPEDFNYSSRLIDNIRKKDFLDYYDNYSNEGLYSWYISRMLKNSSNLHLCKVETLAEDFYRALVLLGVEIPTTAIEFLIKGRRMNEMKTDNAYLGGKVPLPRSADYTKYYTKELETLIMEADKECLEQLDYKF